MELYLTKRSDEFNIHDERDVFEATSIEDAASPQVDWCNWGVTQSKDECFFTSTIPCFEDLNINGQNLYAQTINEPSTYEGNRSSCASICGQTSLMGCGLRNSKDFDGHPDSELENNMEEMDDTFFNSFVEDDEIIPDSVYISLPFEDLSNMDSDSQSWLDSAGRGKFAYVSSSSSLLFMDHELEDCENANDNLSRRLMPAESKRTEGSTADVLSATKYDTVSDADEQPQGFEATVLLELEDVMIQLSAKTRICLRDSLYRLAKNSKQQHITHQKESVSCSDKLPTAQNAGESYSDMPSGENSGMAVRAECVESNANVIDWTVANLMYNTAMCDPQLLSP